MRNLTLNGGPLRHDPPGPDHLCDFQNYSWIYLQNAANVRLEHVFIERTLGKGLHAQQWRDSVCHDLQFGTMGSTTYPQMIVQSNVTAISENLVFEACRWEGNPNRALTLYQAERASFLGCKWHGALAGSPPMPTNTLAHVLLQETYHTMFSGCRFANSLSGMIDALDSSGLLMTGCILNGAQGYGIGLTNTNYSVITGNFFQNTADIGNNIVPVGCTGNDTTDNTFTTF